MNSRLTRPIGALALGAMWLVLASLSAAAQDAPATEGVGAAAQARAAEDELQTMTKVLEDTINEAGLKDWQVPSGDLSIFSPLIRAEYIPTVGAIFTISVNFCITESAVVKEAPEPAEQDLWKKHSSATASPLSVISKGLGNPRELQIALQKQSRMFSAGTREYDAEKVRMFRKAIIEALAKYGHRIEHVGGSERLLVVIEAPKPAMPIEAAGGPSDAMRALPQGAKKSVGGAPGTVVGGGYGGGYGGGGGGYVGSYGGAGGVGGYGAGGFVGGGYGGGVFKGPGAPAIFNVFCEVPDKDHQLIAVNKADVMTSMTYEQLEAKVQEIRY